MHLIATYLLFLMLWALSTSEKVPSPFLPINLYSVRETDLVSFKQLSELTHACWAVAVPIMAWTGRVI